jgi:hypothetical protein
MGALVILLLILVIAFILLRSCHLKCHRSEGYAGQTFASRAGGIAGPAPNYPNYTAPSSDECENYSTEGFAYADGYEKMHFAPPECPYGCPQSCPYGCAPGFNCPYKCPASQFLPPYEKESQKEHCCGR